MRTLCALAASALLLVGCGGGGSTPTTPTTPSTQNPPPPTNRAPIVNSVTVNPTTGIQDRTLFNFSVSASDPDGDAITYSWNVAGNAASGQNVSFTFINGFAGDATVTVSDGKGGTASGTQTFLVNTLTGSWTGSSAAWGAFTASLTQVGGVITGTYRDKDGSAVVGPTGEPGTIDGNGNFSLRIKQAPYTDFYFRGTIDATGRRATGTVSGSGATGQSFWMQK